MLRRGRSAPIDRRTVFIALSLSSVALALAWLPMPQPLWASSYGGAPALRHFLPTQYGGSDQIFGLAQTASGEMLFADVNDRMIWRFDGERWRPIELEAAPLVLASGEAPSGVPSPVWLGASGDLGYLERVPGPARDMRFVSLRAQVPAGPCSDNDHFDDLQVTEQRTFFGQNSALLAWDGETFRCWTPPDGERFGWSHAVDDRLLVGAGSGQFELVGEQFRPLPDWGPAADEVEQLPDGRYLILRHGERAVEIHDPRRGTFEAVPGALWDLLQESFVQKAVALADGRVAVSLGRGGLALVDSEGRLVQHLTEASGLPGGEAYRLFVDRDGLLWVSLARGVAVLDLSSPFERFPPASSLSGYLTDLIRHQGFLFAATFDGVFWFDETARRGKATADASPNGFTRLEGDLEPGADSWDLAVLEDGALYVVSDSGVSRVEPDEVQVWRARTVADRGPLWIGQLAQEDRVLAVGNQRLQVMATDTVPWRTVFRIDLPSYAALVVAERPTRHWILGDGGLKIADFPAEDDFDEPPRLQSFRDDVEWFGLTRIDGRLTAWGSDGVFVLRQGADSAEPEGWERDARFAALDLDRLLAHPTGYDLQDDLQGGAWVSSLFGFERWVPGEPSGGGAPETESERSLRRQPHSGLWGQRLGAVYADPDEPGVVWFERDGVVSRFDDALTDDVVPPAQPPLVSRTLPRRAEPSSNGLVASSRSDLESRGALGRPDRVDTLPHSREVVRFEYSSPRFLNPERTEYRVFLEGYDPDWLEWNRETRKDYTSLREGSYVFRVQARVADDLLGEASYALRVLPPWYRSMWFRLVSGALIAITILILAWMFRRRLQTRREEEERARESLELLVAERTRQLQSANRALEEQAVTDALTGLHNRRYLRETLPPRLKSVHGALERGDLEGGLGFVLIDLNLFKQVNDSFGHGVGDLVLEQVADRLRAACTDGDLLVRWGGDEFLVVCTREQREVVTDLARRICAAIADRAVDLPAELEASALRISASVGFCVFPLASHCDLSQEPERSLELADRCLYLAKRAAAGGWCGIVSSSLDAPIARGESLRLDLDTQGVQIVASPSVLAAKTQPRRRATDRLDG